MLKKKQNKVLSKIPNFLAFYAQNKNKSKSYRKDTNSK